MHLKIAASALALFTAVANAETRISFYTAKDCSSGYLSTATGHGSASNTEAENEFSYTVNAYVGGIAIDNLDDFQNQLNDDNGCVFTDITCCEYAPKCKEPSPVPSSGGYCITYDKYMGTVGVSSTVCDSLCIDNVY
ncbi:hypothetical protein DPSP01_010754 [Paraphaeosphaeria sporulosa]|uniref:Uncharacterized protein n=1 Tax=Paraphaeosphaeria sporulosa TaxID=1460663 RepID=A0A177CVH2_9PLEO|nr:uncharacterized protein CC84DRAFT_1211222 [Paraphaeosphaeria sporulosa]OAG11564.1 hypothetical protein CC84DRAFT_1211222 [Paraphaeosphaeria sporulosa]